MFRVLCALAVPLFCTALTARAADPDKLPFGEDFKGEMTIDSKIEFTAYFPVVLANGGKVNHFLGGNGTKYQATYTLALEENKDYTVTVTVNGTGRSVCMVLVDPAGDPVLGTVITAKTAQQTFKKVNATGTYKLIVASDKIGGFTVNVKGPPGAKPDLAALEAKRKRLQAELDAVNAEIEALKKK